MSPEQVKGGTARCALRSVFLRRDAGRDDQRAGIRSARRRSAETLSAVLREPPDLGDATPPAVAAVVRRLLAKDPEERYASAADVRADLATLLSTSGSGHTLNVATMTSPVTGSPSSAWPRLRRPSRRCHRPGTHAAWWKTGVAVLGIGIAAYLVARSAASGAGGDGAALSDRLPCFRSTTTPAMPARTTSPKG